MSGAGRRTMVSGIFYFDFAAFVFGCVCLIEWKEEMEIQIARMIARKVRYSTTCLGESEYIINFPNS